MFYQTLKEARRSFTAEELTSLMQGDGGGGFNLATRELSAAQELRITEAMELLARYREGKVDPDLMAQAFRPQPSAFAYPALQKLAPHVFTESMTTSDFASLTSTVMNRTLLPKWESVVSPYEKIVKVRKGIKDFRPLTSVYTDGGEGRFVKRGEDAPHRRRSISDASLSYTVEVYEAGFGWNWESQLNDDLGILNDLPDRLVMGGKFGITMAVAETIADASGPHASIYTSGNGNIVTMAGTPNPALSIDSLGAAMAQLMEAKTADGISMGIPAMVTLVVASGALWLQAQHLKNTLDFEQGGSAPYRRVKNWIMPQFDIVYMPELANVMTSNEATAWWLFAQPTALARPFIELGFLRGFDSPQMFRKSANTERLGGGVVPEMGDFETLETQIKGMLVFGIKFMFPQGSVASDGTGS